MLCMCVTAATIDAKAENELPPTETLNTPQTLVNEKLEYYKHLYPDILFMVFKGGDEWLVEIMALDFVLGYQPENMDYEHPPHLREDLLFVSVERIIQMLQYQAPSASLFKADNPSGWQEHVCVLTIAPDKVASDSIQATQHLLNLPGEVIRKIPPNFQLQSDDYLEFVFDHEVYHCLKSMYVGPQKRSHKEFWAEYNHFLDEQGADAYALAMHIKTRAKLTPFASNVQRIRGMALYNADPDHLTCKALEQVLKVPVVTITQMNAKEIFDLANRIKNDQKISYDDYTHFLSSAVQAMKELEVETPELEELRKQINGIDADPEQVRKLVANTRRCLSELSGELKP